MNCIKKIFLFLFCWDLKWESETLSQQRMYITLFLGCFLGAFTSSILNHGIFWRRVFWYSHFFWIQTDISCREQITSEIYMQTKRREIFHLFIQKLFTSITSDSFYLCTCTLVNSSNGISAFPILKFRIHGS